MLDTLIYRLKDKYHNTIRGIKNLIKWFPVIWNDNDWDSHLIYQLLIFKSNDLKKGITHYDNTTSTSKMVKELTLFNKLCTLVSDEYYTSEPYSYFDMSDIEFEEALIKDENGRKLYQMKEPIYSNIRLDEYYSKYKKTYERVKAENPDYDDMRLYIYVAQYNHQKAKRIMFKLMDYKIEQWWD